MSTTVVLSAAVAHWLAGSVADADPVAEVEIGNRTYTVRPGEAKSFDLLRKDVVAIKRVSRGDLTIANKSRDSILNLSWIDPDIGELDQPIAPRGSWQLDSEPHDRWILTVA